jgi:hypothetical protein
MWFWSLRGLPYTWMTLLQCTSWGTSDPDSHVNARISGSLRCVAMFACRIWYRKWKAVQSESVSVNFFTVKRGFVSILKNFCGTILSVNSLNCMWSSLQFLCRAFNDAKRSVCIVVLQHSSTPVIASGRQCERSKKLFYIFILWARYFSLLSSG